ncbi:MAG TPA: type II and III secretion system protein family protein, partial [Bauldia sp.]|nr:type II and III secretion system protein family protein [Bauldia sp.]
MSKLTLAAAAFAAAGLVGAALSAPALADEEIVTGAPVTKAVQLGLNKSIVIDLPRDARDVLVSNPAIADAVIRTPRRIYLTGIAIGQSNVIVFDRAGQQIVTLDLAVERDGVDLDALLHKLIPDSAITVEVLSDNIILSGSVKNASDSRRAEDLANAFVGGAASSSATTSSGSTPAAAGATNSFTIVASATAQDATTAQKPKVINLLTIEGEDQVHLKVTVAEVQRSAIKQLGIDWNLENFNLGKLVLSGATHNAFPVNGAPSSAVSGNYIDNIVVPDYGGDPTSTLSARRSIGATIKALEQTGLFRTLAEPTLTAISGESASFLAGGEFPVPTGRDANGMVTIEFKQFGVALAFTPVVLSEGRISLRVKTEVSELSQDGSLQLAGTSIPSLKVRRAETTMELPSGGAMVMGGLLQDDVRQSLSGLPGLKKLPVLGTLFRSRDYQRAETELVIIVTPYLVKPVSRNALARPDDGFAPAPDVPATFLGKINRV